METTDSPDLTSTTPGGDAPPQSTRCRRVIHITCSVHGGCRGFTNLVVTKRDGTIVLDPHGTDQCVLILDELRPPSCGRFSGSRSGERAISEGHGSSAGGRLGGRAGLRDKRVCDGLRRAGQLVGPAAGTVSCRVRRRPRYCPQCVHAALRWSAELGDDASDAGLVSPSVTARSPNLLLRLALFKTYIRAVIRPGLLR